MSEDKKKKPLWFRLHVGDVMADTAHLSCEQLGAFMRLLFALWRTDDCTLPNDESRLRKFSRVHPPNWQRVWGEIKLLFEPFPQEGSDEITNRSLWMEFQEAEQRLAIAGANGRKSAESRAAGMNQTPESGSNQTASNPLKNNNGGFAAAQLTQHNTTQQKQKQRQRREEKDSCPLRGPQSEKENGLQEKRSEIVTYLYKRLPPSYTDSITQQILDEAVDAELEQRGEGLALLAHHHESKAKEKG